MLREIKGLGQIKTKFLLQIYNSLIGSVFFFISSPCKHINPNGDICLSVFSFLLHLSSWFLMGNFVEYELIFPMSLMAISSLLQTIPQFSV
jgi:hypothetical protein